jgi:predicted ester cyclase
LPPSASGRSGNFRSEELAAWRIALGEGDVVVTRWTATGTHQGDLMGMPATGKQATAAGISIDHFADGKLVAGWAMFDQLGFLQQLDAVPTPGA